MDTRFEIAPEIDINSLANDIDVVFVGLQRSMNNTCNGKPGLVGLISLAAAIRWYKEGLQFHLNKDTTNAIIDEVVHGDAFGLNFVKEQ